MLSEGSANHFGYEPYCFPAAKYGKQGTSAAWTAFKVCPLAGYGNGNYMYALDTATGQDSTKSFTSMPPNTLARILVEKGIVGT